MGMSGSFGGSTTQAWSAVSTFFANLANQGGSLEPREEVPSGLVPLEPERVHEPDPAAAPLLASLIAKALQSDDTAIRPRSAPRATGSDSGLSYGQLVGHPRRIGTTRSAPTTGRRHISSGIGKAGRAIGAGYALVSGDASQLSEYGLDLQTLEGRDRYSQIFEILEAVDVENSGPDDIALRETIVTMLDRIIGPEAETPSPEDTLLELVSTYTNKLLSIELDALIQRGLAPAEMVNTHRTELADYISIRASRLDASGAKLTNPEQFEHAARELLRATLDILSVGEDV